MGNCRQRLTVTSLSTDTLLRLFSFFLTWVTFLFFFFPFRWNDAQTCGRGVHASALSFMTFRHSLYFLLFFCEWCKHTFLLFSIHSSSFVFFLLFFNSSSSSMLNFVFFTRRYEIRDARNDYRVENRMCVFSLFELTWNACRIETDFHHSLFAWYFPFTFIFQQIIMKLDCVRRWDHWKCSIRSVLISCREKDAQIKSSGKKCSEFQKRETSFENCDNYRNDIRW